MSPAQYSISQGMWESWQWLLFLKEPNTISQCVCSKIYKINFILHKSKKWQNFTPSHFSTMTIAAWETLASSPLSTLFCLSGTPTHGRPRQRISLHKFPTFILMTGGGHLKAILRRHLDVLVGGLGTKLLIPDIALYIICLQANSNKKQETQLVQISHQHTGSILH